MQRLLKLIQNQGILKKDSLHIITRGRDREALINQGIYFGLISHLEIGEGNCEYYPYSKAYDL